MTPPVWKRNEPDSPCVDICQIHTHEKICIGCYRTGAEISAWPHMSPEARKAMMAELPARASRLRKRRPKRARD